MKEMTGVCRFCGQTKLIQLAADDVEDPEAEADDIVTSQCTCRSAREAAGEIERRKRIRQTIDEIFREEPEQADFVWESACAVMNGVIMKCSTDIGEMKHTFFMKGEKLIYGRKKIINRREEF